MLDDFGEMRIEEILWLARSLAWVRPLAPYPGWRFDAEWDNPSLAFRLRRQIWAYFHDRAEEVPLTVPWHHDLSLRLLLSNDISKQLFIGGCLEPNEFCFLDRHLKPGMVFIDIGANEGLYSLFASKKVGDTGSVWSFEPSPREFDRLTHNVKLNKLDNVQHFPIALANYNGIADLKIAENQYSGQNTLGEFCYDIGLAATEKVGVEVLDQLVSAARLTRVDFVKIDAEGAEAMILEGARETIEAMRPVLLIEVLENALNKLGSSAEMILEFLADREYQVFGFDPDAGEPRLYNQGRLSDNILVMPLEKCGADLAACNEERTLCS